MLPKEKPQEGQLLWMLFLAVEWMVLGSAWGSSSSSSDLHLLSPTPGGPLPRALPRPDHPQGPHGPRHHQPLVSIYRSPASLRAGHGEFYQHVYTPPPQGYTPTAALASFRYDICMCDDQHVVNETTSRSVAAVEPHGVR